MMKLLLLFMILFAATSSVHGRADNGRRLSKSSSKPADDVFPGDVAAVKSQFAFTEWQIKKQAEAIAVAEEEASKTKGKKEDEDATEDSTAASSQYALTETQQAAREAAIEAEEEEEEASKKGGKSVPGKRIRGRQ